MRFWGVARKHFRLVERPQGRIIGGQFGAKAKDKQERGKEVCESQKQDDLAQEGWDKPSSHQQVQEEEETIEENGGRSSHGCQGRSAHGPVPLRRLCDS